MGWIRKALQKGFVTILKNRLDVILTERGFFASREKARASIMAGLVYVDGQRIDKAGTSVDTEAEIHIKENLCPYLRRGVELIRLGIEAYRKKNGK